MLAITMFFLPTTLSMPSQAQSRAIVTAIGVDKTEDNLYEVTLALITPKNSGQVAGGNMVDTGTGKSVAIAMQMLSINLGKVIGLQHCNFIIVSDKVFSEDVTKILDYFIRSNNLTADAHLINCPKSAKELISQGASASNTSIATINDIIQFNNEYLYSEAVTIYEFYNRQLSPAKSVFVPILELEGEENIKDSNSSSSDKSGLGTNDNSSNVSGGASEDQGTNSSKLMSNGKCAVVKNGVKVRELTENERLALNVINKGKGSAIISVENFSDDVLNNASVYMQLVIKKSGIKGYFENGKPKIKFNIVLIVKLDEIVMDNYSIDSVSGLTSYMSPKLKEAITEKLNSCVMELVENLQNDNADIIFVYDHLNRFHCKEFKQFLNGLENKDEYLKYVDFETNINIRSKI